MTLPGEADVLLQPGDLIVIPYGTSHVLSDVAGRDAVPLENIMASTGYTGEGAFVIGSGDPTASTQLVCGHPPRSAVLMHESSDTRPRAVVPDWRVETLQIVPISPLIVPVCSRDIAGQSLFNA